MRARRVGAAHDGPAPRRGPVRQSLTDTLPSSSHRRVLQLQRGAGNRAVGAWPGAGAVGQVQRCGAIPGRHRPGWPNRRRRDAGHGDEELDAAEGCVRFTTNHAGAGLVGLAACGFDPAASRRTCLAATPPGEGAGGPRARPRSMTGHPGQNTTTTDTPIVDSCTACPPTLRGPPPAPTFRVTLGPLGFLTAAPTFLMAGEILPMRLRT